MGVDNESHNDDEAGEMALKLLSRDLTRRNRYHVPWGDQFNHPKRRMEEEESRSPKKINSYGANNLATGGVIVRGSLVKPWFFPKMNHTGKEHHANPARVTPAGNRAKKGKPQTFTAEEKRCAWGFPR